MLGKRKRNVLNTVELSSGYPTSGSQEDLQDVFKRHFEAQFQPLPNQASLVISKPTIALAQDTDSSDWDGLSSDDETEGIEVVEYTAPTNVEKVDVPKEELKGFMVSSHYFSRLYVDSY